MDAAATVRPNMSAPAAAHVPEMVVVRPTVPHMVHFDRPEIPDRPMIPGHH